MWIIYEEIYQAFVGTSFTNKGVFLLFYIILNDNFGMFIRTRECKFKKISLGIGQNLSLLLAEIDYR